MTHAHLVRPAFCAALLAALLLAACEPLPDYPTRFRLEIGGDASAVVTGDDPDAAIAVFGEIGSSGEENLLILITSDAEDDGVGFLFHRYEDDAGRVVERLRVNVGDGTYDVEPAPGAVDETFELEPYDDPDFPGALGRLGGSLPGSTVAGAAGAEIEVSLTNVDALARAAGEAPEDP